MAGIKARVNINDLKKFQAQMSRLNEAQRQQWSEAAVKELAARLLSRVIRRTPVGQYPNSSGKKGGTLRRGWTVGNVRRTGSEYNIDVINPVMYAQYVEFGHRTRNHRGWVEGRFMLTISEVELQTDAPKILKNKLNAFIGGVFNK